MFQIGDHVMLKENGANDHLSCYYGRVFEVKGISYRSDFKEIVRVGCEEFEMTWFPERLEKINEVEPIEFDEVLNLL